MKWREETEEETADREAEWNAVYVRCRTCHFGSIETEFGEDQCPDCSSTMFVPVDGPVYREASTVEHAHRGQWDCDVEGCGAVMRWMVEVGEDSTP